jgi:hypothetical protein
VEEASEEEDADSDIDNEIKAMEGKVGRMYLEP